MCVRCVTFKWKNEMGGEAAKENKSAVSSKVKLSIISNGWEYQGLRVSAEESQY